MQKISFISSSTYIDYNEAVAFMEDQVTLIRHKKAPETVWFLEHAPLYTAGTSAHPKDLLDHSRFPIYQTGRGGQYTYHGPNQLIAYLMIDIQSRQIGIREYIKCLEEIIINTLAVFNVKGEIRQDRVGVWVADQDIEEKIAAIGVRVRRGVTYHGIAINIAPDLTAFEGIVPCGLKQFGVTSFEKLNLNISRSDIENILQKNIETHINRII